MITFRLRKLLLVLITLSILIGIITGCGADKANLNESSSKSRQSEAAEGNTQKPSESSTQKPAEESKQETSGLGRGDKITSLQSYIDIIMEIEGQHEAAINRYDGMPVLEVPSALVSIATLPMYEILNLEDKDGRFEGIGFGSGMPEFIEKNGAQITFGRDGVREEDGFSPEDKKGDRIVEQGSLDGDKGSLRTEHYTERNGAKVNRYVIQSVLTDADSIALLYQYGKSGDRSNSTAVFLTAGKNHYNFVVATGDGDADFAEIPLSFTDAEDAVAAFEANGYTIDKTGGVKDGVYEVIES